MDPVIQKQIDDHQNQLRELYARQQTTEVTSQPQWSDASFYKQEMKKWNAPRPPQEFPKQLIKAHKNSSGEFATEEYTPDRWHFQDDAAWLRAAEKAERFAATCRVVVANREEQDKYERDGWCEHRAQALEKVKQWEKDIALAAAHRAHDDRRMSDAAKAEAKAVEEANDEHVAAIPEAPKAKRKYTKKAKPTVQA